MMYLLCLPSLMLPAFFYFVLFALGTHASRRPVLPSLDPFYTPTSGFENTLPGAILKKRELGHRSLGVFGHFPQNVKNVYQFLYRTNDGRNQPTVAVTTLIIPYNANYSTLISHQTAEDSISKDCAASYTFRQGSKARDRLVEAELLFIDSLLQHGWPVLVSDYEGVDAMFAVGLMEGHGVLDGIRAALASGNVTGMKSDAQVQLFGYSGGALASGFAAQMIKTYAPELNIIGCAMGGIPVDLEPMLLHLKGSGFEILGVLGLMGMLKQYPELEGLIQSVTRPDKREEFALLQSICLSESLKKYGSHGMDYFFNQTEFLAGPGGKMALGKSYMGGYSVPEIPLFMFHAQKDEVIPYSAVEKMYKQWCQAGATIEFVLDTQLLHGPLQFAGAANGILFLERMFKGIAPPPHCTMRSTSFSAMDHGAPAVFSKIIWNAFSAILGFPIGPNLP